MSALFALASLFSMIAIASAFLISRRRRGNDDLLRRFDHRDLLDLFVVAIRAIVLNGRTASFVLAGPASASSTAASRKLSARLAIAKAGFRVGVNVDGRLSAFTLGCARAFL